MGFSEYERIEFRKSCRDKDDIEILLDTQYPVDIVEFIKSEGHIRRTRDYCIFQKRQAQQKPEQVIVTYLLDSETSIYDILMKWGEFLSPPVSHFISIFRLLFCIFINYVFSSLISILTAPCFLLDIYKNIVSIGHR